MDLTGDYMICSAAQGGCGEPFKRGSRAIIITARQLQRINAADGDVRFSEFESQSGMFCEDCIDNLDSHGGILTRHCSRGEYVVNFAWLMKRTNY